MSSVETVVFFWIPLEIFESGFCSSFFGAELQSLRSFVGVAFPSSLYQFLTVIYNKCKYSVNFSQGFLSLLNIGLFLALGKLAYATAEVCF